MHRTSTKLVRQLFFSQGSPNGWQRTLFNQKKWNEYSASWCGSAGKCHQVPQNEGFGEYLSAKMFDFWATISPLPVLNPLRLLFSGTVVHVSSLESEWKNLIYHSSSDFTSKFSRFFVYFHTVDFQGPSRNLDLTLIFSPKMIFCPIFWYFLGVLESTTTSQLDSTNGQPEVLLRLPESQKILFFSQAEKC